MFTVKKAFKIYGKKIHTKKIRNVFLGFLESQKNGVKKSADLTHLRWVFVLSVILVDPDIVPLVNFMTMKNISPFVK